MRSSVAILALAACTSETPISPIPDPDGGEALVEAVTDVVVQPPDAMVDVLFVIDDSCSMGDDQEELAAAFPQLVAWFEAEGLDYHVGVVSTDTYSDGRPGGVLRRAGEVAWIDPDTLDPEATFWELATVGTDGADSERGLGAAYLALGIRADDENAGFLRPEASLHTIVVSDEDDDTPATLVDPEQFVDFYDALKDQPDRRTFSSIVQTSGTYRGSTYLAVTGALGGASADLQDSWLNVLDRLGNLIAEPMDEYHLSRQPIEASLTVTLEIAGKPVPVARDGWTFDQTRNTVTFVDRVLQPGTRVVLDYLTE